MIARNFLGAGASLALGLLGLASSFLLACGGSSSAVDPDGGPLSGDAGTLDSSSTLDGSSPGADSGVDGGAGDGGICVGSTNAVGEVDGGIVFELNVSAAGSVCYYGAPPYGEGCGDWLGIAPAGGSPLLITDTCLSGCPATGAAPAGTPQTLSWNGTIYLFDPATLACTQSTCLPPGNYVATMCATLPGNFGECEGLGPDGGPAVTPTCTQVPFVWPPQSPNETVTGTIALKPPTP